MAETASGWQEVSLDPPVAIAANTTYIASYFSSAGYYAATLNYFTSQATVTGPLTALASGTDGPNGLYRYGASAFPDQTAADANYWVDVVFSTEPPAQDTTPPIVITRTPNNGVSGVLVGTNVIAQFSEALVAATVNTGTIELRAPGGALVPAAVTWVAGHQLGGPRSHGQPRLLDHLHRDRQGRRGRRHRRRRQPAGRGT